MATKMFDIKGNIRKSGFYGLSSSKKGIKSTFQSTMKAKMKQLGVKHRGNR